MFDIDLDTKHRGLVTIRKRPIKWVGKHGRPQSPCTKRINYMLAFCASEPCAV